MIFYVIVGWDWGTPAILQQNPNKITLVYGCGFGLKSWDWQTPPTPQLGQNPKFFQKSDLKAPLSLTAQRGSKCKFNKNFVSQII